MAALINAIYSFFFFLFSLKVYRKCLLRYKNWRKKKKMLPTKWLFAWVKSENNEHIPKKKSVRKRFDEWSALLWWRYYYLISQVKCWSAQIWAKSNDRIEEKLFSRRTLKWKRQRVYKAWKPNNQKMNARSTHFEQEKKGWLRRRSGRRKKNTKWGKIWQKHKANEAYK